MAQEEKRGIKGDREFGLKQVVGFWHHFLRWDPLGRISSEAGSSESSSGDAHDA